MKTSAIAFLTLSAILALLISSPVVGHESMLADEEESVGSNLRRRLSWFDWTSTYYRCCNTSEGEGATEGDPSLGNDAWRRSEVEADDYPGQCKCKKRGSGDVGFFSKLFGKTESHFDKWQTSCKSGGTIYKKAGISEL
eukprot:CAMPEP_0201629744 /NCGR_PEP_ID=MMETSP0493-20130528/4302_1 /ASSEMBLY_ACC=CAM_ASM_000838 /TAXON_ID=420259 /ORGANISM="Thalassiosira gravida, Strain GMp14c1" /LENGTH=138 /DNA_ID=CAMNT_0048100785 /DNA_START=1626 /DNA_END=2042 /DNA_ORIENTATION=-